MISVGSRDARKGIRLGFDSGGSVGDMEETELEEGEAFSYHNSGDYDESIDPDVALSYIDEKLQDVLGHFQKDFEGGVSAENLGAKFGGYGSFLPTYQRSPVCSHPRTPAKVQNHNSPRSPNDSQLEGGLRHSAVSSTTSQPIKLGPALKSLSLNDPPKQEIESANKKSFKLSDQNALKVRIKVGSDNISMPKNAEIYTGLGLDASPSSSLDQSPSGSEGMFHEDALNQSPTSILQIMTSFPVHGNLLLSPLPDDLLHLTEKVKFIKEARKVNGSDSVKGDRKVLGEKKMKFNGSVKDVCNNVVLTSKKERDFDALCCEELVSNTLKLPMLINEDDWFNKPKVEEDKKVSSFDNVSVFPRKDGDIKEEKSLDSVKAESYVSKIKKSIHAAKESSFSGGKRKSKGSHIRGNLAVEDTKESSRLGSSVPKSKKSTHANGSTTKNDVEDLKMRKKIVKARDAYRDFFGNADLDEQDNQIDALEISSAINDALKERSSSKKIDKPSTSEAYSKAVSDIPPRSTSGLTPAPSGTQFILDNWVGCDKCQQWRLLPLGTNTEDLPDKWTCSMLNWLPKMNRCSVTEEETTKALLALYQVPTAENQNYLHNAGAVISGASPAGFWNQSHQNYGLHAVPNATCKDGSNLTKKNPHTSFRSTKLDDNHDMNRSSLMNKSDSQQLSKSSEHYSGGGDTRNVKLKSKRGADQDCLRASKKVKTESDEDWKFDYDGANGKMGTSSSNGFEAKKDQLKYRDRCSSKEMYDAKDVSQVDVSLDLENCNNRIIAPKKRKMDLNPRRDVEDFSENGYGKEKKARVSKSEGKESYGSKGKDVGSTLSQRSLDLGSSQAATSSSSKISGSHKTKTSFQEVKGSPVESVSSSPMRILDSDKFTSARTNLKEKDETRGAEFFSVDSPRKCFDSGTDRSARKDKTFSVTHRSVDSVLDFHDKNGSNLLGGEAKTKVVPSSDIHIPNKTQTSCRYEEEKQKRSESRKSGKGSSRSKDKSRREKHEDASKSRSKISGSVNDSQDAKLREGKTKFQERSGVKSDETENKHVGKKDCSRKLSCDGSDVKADPICTQDPLSVPKQNLQNHDGERSLKRPLFEKNDQKDLASVNGRPLPLPPSGGGQNETLGRCPWPVSLTHKGNGADKLAVDASEVGDALKGQKQIRKADNQNPSGHRVRDYDAPSPLKRDSSSHAANIALKEAKDLKHRADRIKNTESDMGRTDLYLEAVLKFLRASSLLESSNGENGKQGEMTQAVQIYSSTAKLCDFCAHEYEKQKNMALAALAYKCTEVAYMRVIYSSHSNASRDRHELQSTLQMVPPGESPCSSSASDVENLNNLAMADKVIAPKSLGSPQVAGNHTIAAKNRPNFLRLLNFTEDVHLAMEASRKSRIAFAAANASLSDAKYKEGMSSIKRALDFNFQDVEGLLRLVKLAIEAFNS